MALTYKASLSLKALAVVTFGVYLAVAAELMLQLSALISVRIVMPSIALSLALVAALDVQFTLALALTLPSLQLNLVLALQYELAIVLALIATIKGILSGSLIAYAYGGSGSGFGPTLDGQIKAGWPDGTSPNATATAWLFVATASGPLTPDQVDTVALVPPAATPPMPPWPPPPPSPAPAYPPPQAYEQGMASVSFPSAVYPSVVYPADPALGTLTIDNSVATGIGAVTGVTITHHGSGYTGPPFVVISDTVTAVGVTNATPPVITLPSALSIPVASGFGVTVAGVHGTTAITGATNASPIVVTMPSTTGLASAFITGVTGNVAANGQWFCQVLSPTTAALWLDSTYSVPSAGSGAYTGGGLIAGNVNGIHFAKVLAGQTTIALYQDSAMSVPVVGWGSYAGGSGTVTGGGLGATAVATMGGQAQHALKSFFAGMIWPDGITSNITGGATTLAVICKDTFALLALLLDNLTRRSQVLLAATASASIKVLPPSISANIALLAKMTANMSANLKVTPPSFSISAQVNAILKIVAKIQAALGIGDVTLEIWEYDGPSVGFGSAIAAGPGSSGWHDGTSAGSVVAAAVLGCTSGASVSVVRSFFGGLP